MARGDKTRAPVDVLPGKMLIRKDPEVEKPKPHMVALKTKYLPNLKPLVFPKVVYEQAERLVITPLMAFNHDPVAAEKLRGERCASFELPRDVFPQGAPIWKIIFLPEQLLPEGFNAGGVFASGVLARKYYPDGLLNANHKGQTPALFVGHRSADCIVPKDAPGRAPPSRPRALTPAPSPAPGAYMRSLLVPTVADAANMNLRLIRNNITVAEVIIMPAFPKPRSCYPSAVPIQMQYNMYVPDLSQVIFAMQEAKHTGYITVAIISTIHQPNVPKVALSTMGSDRCPRFQLPTDIFPVDLNRLGPRFLPQRFLPDFCDAGCVYPPGSLPESVFQGNIRTRFNLEQYHYSMTPPLFVGRRKQQKDSSIKIEPVAVQMEKVALKSIVKPPARGAAAAAAAAAAPGVAAQSRTNAPATIPDGTQRSNDFKKSAAAGKPKGFVLIESDHVPRGAIPTDFFAAYLVGCFFKITPSNNLPVTFGTVGEIRTSSEGISVVDSSEGISVGDSSEEDGEYLDFHDAKEYPEPGAEADEDQEYEPEESGVSEDEAAEYEGVEEDEEETEIEEIEADEADDADDESEDKETKTEKKLAEKKLAEKKLAEKNQAEKNQAEKNQTDKKHAEKAQAEKNQAEKNQTDKKHAEKNQAEKNQADEADGAEEADDESEDIETKTDKKHAEKAQAKKNQAEKNQAEKDQTKKNQAEKNQAEKNHAEKNQAEKNQTEKNHAEKSPAEKAQPEKSQPDKNQAEKTQAEKSQLEKSQAEKTQAEKARAAIANEIGTDDDEDYEPFDYYDSDSTESVGVGALPVLSYFNVDSNLDDIAIAAGNLDTARFEVIVHPSELPGINVERAVEQFRQVLQTRNNIRAKMTGHVKAHEEKMEADRKKQQENQALAPSTLGKRVYRKPCSHCGKYH